MKAFILKIVIFLMIIFIVFAITSGILFKDESIVLNDVEHKNTTQEYKNSYDVVNYEIKKDYDLYTEFEMDGDTYISSESDLDVTELLKVLSEVEYREEVEEFLGETPEVLKGGVREEVYILGKADNYKTMSKTLENYKKDIKKGFVNYIILIKYDEERIVQNYIIFKEEDKTIISYGKKGKNEI